MGQQWNGGGNPGHYRRHINDMRIREQAGHERKGEAREDVQSMEAIFNM